MAKQFESGHAKNVSNFADLIALCVSYGIIYNPANPAISIAALNLKKAAVTAAMHACSISQQNLTLAVDDRQMAFDSIQKRVTRVLLAVKSLGFSDKFYEDVKSIARKLSGKRAGSLPDPNAPAGPERGSHSSSQMSYDNRIVHFRNLVNLLSTQSAYAPNESDLSLAALNTMLSIMISSNDAATAAEITLSNDRLNRNSLMYGPGNGMIKLAGEIRAYIRSIFGMDSAQNKQIARLKFTTPR